MSTIYREQAIDAMGCLNDSICEQQAVDALWELPSAEKTGKWINSHDSQGNHYKRCSECGAYIEATFFANDYSVNFCPNCGADMRGEENVKVR